MRVCLNTYPKNAVYSPMPFTFSHPAIVLPLKKIQPAWFSLTGLVIGSMSPDMMYFLQMSGEEDYGHTLAGIFVFDIPVTLLLTIVFHLWIRNTLLLYLPAPFNRKFAKYMHHNIFIYLRKKWYLVVISAFIGAVTHILWDYTGYPQGWVYELAPDFFGKTLHVGPIQLPMYLFIEYAGSVLGLLFIGWAFLQEKGEEPVRRVSATAKIVFWLCIVFFTVAVIAVKLYVNPRDYGIGSMFVIGISGFLLAVIICCLMFSFKQSNIQARES
jgi:hypothetical protein